MHKANCVPDLTEISKEINRRCLSSNKHASKMADMVKPIVNYKDNEGIELGLYATLRTLRTGHPLYR